jgi:hypothetical protein
MIHGGTFIFFLCSNCKKSSVTILTLGKSLQRSAAISARLGLPSTPILARGGAPEAVEHAYEEVAARAPEPLAATLRAEARVLHARWN